jgi:hypothetical protein
MDANDTVGYGNHGAFVVSFGSQIEFFDLGFDQVADLGRIQLHGCLPN